MFLLASIKPFCPSDAYAMELTGPGKNNGGGIKKKILACHMAICKLRSGAPVHLSPSFAESMSAAVAAGAVVAGADAAVACPWAEG